MLAFLVISTIFHHIFGFYQVGGQYEGTVKAVSEYGAFVNFGLVNQNGLVHKSQLAHEYVTNPTDYVSVGQKVSVRVLTVDLGMKKISLSMKPKTPAKLTIETMEVGLCKRFE